MIIDGLDVSDCPHLKENGSCEHGGSCDGVCFYFGMLNASQRATESEETILKILKLCEEFKNEYAVNYGVQLFARKIEELIAGEVKMKTIIDLCKELEERIKELEAENEYLKQYRRSVTTCQECHDDGLAENKTIKELKKENEKLKKYQVYADLEKFLEEISQNKPSKRKLEYQLFITKHELSIFKNCNDILIKKLIIAENALRFYAEPFENKPDNEAKKALKEMNALRLGKDVKK